MIQASSPVRPSNISDPIRTRSKRRMSWHIYMPCSLRWAIDLPARSPWTAHDRQRRGYRGSAVHCQRGGRRPAVSRTASWLSQRRLLATSTLMRLSFALSRRLDDWSLTGEGGRRLGPQRGIVKTCGSACHAAAVPSVMIGMFDSRLRCGRSSGPSVPSTPSAAPSPVLSLLRPVLRGADGRRPSRPARRRSRRR